MDGHFLLDMRLHGHDYRTSGRPHGHVFRLHQRHEAVAFGLAVAAQKNGRAKFAVRVGQMAEANTRQVANGGVNPLGIGAHGSYDRIQLAQLRQQHASAELVHAVLRADEPVSSRFSHHMFVQRPQAAQVMEARRALEQQRVVGHHRAALARGDRLVELQAVNAHVAQGAERLAPVTGAPTLRAVFQHLYAVLARNLDDAVQVRRAALQMHRHDQFRLRRDLRFKIAGVQVERFVDLGEDRQRSGEYDGVEAGVPGPGRQDHFVAGTDAERRQRAVQRGCSRRDGKRVAGTHPGGELLLEGGHLHGRLRAWAVPPEWTPGLQHFHHLLPLLLVVVQRAPKVSPQWCVADRRFALGCADPGTCLVVAATIRRLLPVLDCGTEFNYDWRDVDGQGDPGPPWNGRTAEPALHAPSFGRSFA